MGLVDWIILAILLVSMFAGLRKGFLGGVIQIAGMVATFFLFGHFYPLIRNALVTKYDMSPVLSAIFAIVIIFISMAAVVGLLVYFTNRVVKAMKAGFMNKLMGMVLGAVNGLLVVIVLMVLIDYFPKTAQPLKDPVKHKVYSAVDTLKEDAFKKLNLTERDKYKEIREKIKDEQVKKLEPQPLKK
jgi:membrane protein required for colicin V production